jgi:hypothetical protein
MGSITLMIWRFLIEADSWFGELQLKGVIMHHNLHFRFDMIFCFLLLLLFGMFCL